MLKKTITYIDYNGVERTEDFYFNLSKAEIMELELENYGGLSETIKRLTREDDVKNIYKIFKEIVLKSYGEKSVDGRRFVKIDENGQKLSDKFAQTEAFSDLITELSTNADRASDCINNIVPKSAD